MLMYSIESSVTPISSVILPRRWHKC